MSSICATFISHIVTMSASSKQYCQGFFMYTFLFIVRRVENDIVVHKSEIGGKRKNNRFSSSFISRRAERNEVSPRSSVSIFRTTESRCFSRGLDFDSFFFPLSFLALSKHSQPRVLCLIKYANIFILRTRLHGCWLIVIVMDGLSLSNWKKRNQRASSDST